MTIALSQPQIRRGTGICREAGAKRDPGFWHVISIMEPSWPRVPDTGFLSMHRVYFHDVEDDCGLKGVTLVSEHHIREAFRYADAEERWNQPLLIHCAAGQSRSTALALAFLVRGLVRDGFERAGVVKQAVDDLIDIRPVARPNVRVLRLGLETFLPAGEEGDLSRELVNEPRLLANRFKTGSA